MPQPKAQVKAKASIKKNRLHITVSGVINSKLLEKLYTDIRFCVADLKPGFQVVSDISHCQLFYITSLPTYKKIIDFLIAQRAGGIIRIIKHNNISCKQVINLSELIGGYTPLYVQSEEEAEQRLEEVVPRNGIRLKFRHLLFTYDCPAGSGKGTIANISISGCAVENATLPLPLDLVIEGLIGFDPHPTLIGSVQMKARVVRSDGDFFAVQFIDLASDVQEQLFQRFVHELKRARMDV